MYTSVPAFFIIFCDTLQKVFGFGVYLFQSGSAGLIFSKAKVAPLAKRTLPSLELLSVFLAIKCIPKILKGFCFYCGGERVKDSSLGRRK